MITVALIRSLRAKGKSLDEMLDLFEAMEASGSADKKSSAAIRQQRYRDRRNGVTQARNVTSQAQRDVTGVTNVTNDAQNPPSAPAPRAGVLCGEELSNNTLSEPNGSFPSDEKPKKASRRPSRGEPNEVRAELAKVLDDGHTEAVFRYRIAKKAAQTAPAARLLANELAKTGSPNEAADLMMLSDWKGFRLSWWENARSGNNSPQQKQSTVIPFRREAPFTPLIQAASNLHAEYSNDAEFDLDGSAGAYAAGIDSRAVGGPSGAR